MMGPLPSASTVNEALDLLKVVVADPEAAKAHLVAMKAAHAGLDDRLHALNDYETQLSAREAAVVKREQALKSREDDQLGKAAALQEDIARCGSEWAAFNAAKAKNASDYEAARSQIARDQATNTATALKLTAQRDEMASQEVALRSMRVGLEAREKLIEEGEAALAAKQARLVAALQAG